MEQRCETCRFWKGAYAWGACHRNPPHPFNRYGKYEGIWPEVSSHDWCGEWELSQKEKDRRRDEEARIRDDYLGELSRRAEENEGAEDTITSGSRAAAALSVRIGTNDSADAEGYDPIAGKFPWLKGGDK